MDRKTIFGVLLGIMLCMTMGAAPFRWPGSAQYNLMGPPTGSFACVQHNTNKLDSVVRRFRFDAPGTVKLGYIDGSTFEGTVAAGETIDGLFDQVYDTGTALTDAQIHPQK